MAWRSRPPDLRAHDHRPLAGALGPAGAAGRPVAFVYVDAPEEEGGGASWAPGGASRAWLQAALRATDADFRRRWGAGAGIICRRGPAAGAELVRVAKALGAEAVHYGRLYEPALEAQERRVERALAESGIGATSYAGFLLHEPRQIRVDMRKWVGHFGTLTPFVRACKGLTPSLFTDPLPAPQRVPTLDPTSMPPVSGSAAASDFELVALPGNAAGREPTGQRLGAAEPDWPAKLLSHWPGGAGEAAALEQLETFVQTKFARYEGGRQFADGRAVSRLSPHLHFGTLSPNLMMKKMAQKGGINVSKTAWRRLVWRDLAYWQLHHWPDICEQPIRTHYSRQSWSSDEEALQRWKEGRTGWPLVDAGMRELWATGWMQQSIRMVAANFLVEYLNISWVEGAKWFHEVSTCGLRGGGGGLTVKKKCLVDADLAINGMMWQNAGKSGLDQWNFTMNPTSKAQDPDGKYTRRWIPEVAGLPNKFVHAPWEASAEQLLDADVVLGLSYPHRIPSTVDVGAARDQNRLTILQARKAGANWSDAGGYDQIVVPKGASTVHDGMKMRVFTVPKYDTCRLGGGEKNCRD